MYTCPKKDKWQEGGSKGEEKCIGRRARGEGRRDGMLGEEWPRDEDRVGCGRDIIALAAPPALLVIKAG